MPDLCEEIKNRVGDYASTVLWIALAILIQQLCIPSTLSAQPEKRFWSEGSLTWSDFKTGNVPQSGTDLHYFISYRTDRVKRADTVIHRLVAEAYINTELAQVREIDKNDQHLLYNQVIFDMLEYYRRNLQKNLYRANNPFEAYAMLQEVHGYFSADAARFSNETDQGENVIVLREWRELVKDRLSGIHEDPEVQFQKRNLGYGIYGGLGTSIPAGGLAQYFAPSVDLFFGFEFSVKRVLVNLSGSLGAGRIRQDFPDEGIPLWNEGPGSLTRIDLALGYALIDSRKWKVSPFAGLGITEFSFENSGQQDEKTAVARYHVVLGVSTDFKLRKSLKLLPMKVKEYAETSLRFRVSATPVYLYPGISGAVINVSVAFGGFASVVRPRNPEVR
jgi:hypothetical protein